MKIIIEEIKKFFTDHKETLILIFIALIVIGFYSSNFTSLLSNNIKEFLNFKLELSTENGDWGTFGDYFGGILNPITSAFAFYLVAKTYNLQKDSQFEQIKLAALTALLNLNLTKISVLESKKISLLQGSLPEPKSPNKAVHQLTEALQKSSNTDWLAEKIKNRFIQIEDEIKKLEIENIDLENQIKYFLQSK